MYKLFVGKIPNRQGDAGGKNINFLSALHFPFGQYNAGL
jgi:hypothetical protein